MLLLLIFPCTVGTGKESGMKKILIVDDEVRIRDIYVRMFVPEGIIVRVAANAGEAVNILIREGVDLILLDIGMPNIDGRVAFDIIKEYDPQARIIISSVYPIEKQKTMIPGAEDYFDKSEGPIWLLKKVLDALQKGESVSFS